MFITLGQLFILRTGHTGDEEIMLILLILALAVLWSSGEVAKQIKNWFHTRRRGWHTIDHDELLNGNGYGAG